jgi:hypothetical protein
MGNESQGNVEVLNSNELKVKEMFEEVKDLEKYENAEDVEDANVWASLLTDKFLRKTKGKELKAEAEAVMAEYNKWYFRLTDLLEKIKDDGTGFKSGSEATP